MKRTRDAEACPHRAEAVSENVLPTETGLCVTCGKPLPPLAVQEGDDFCSTECARQAHGVQTRTETLWEERSHRPSAKTRRAWREWSRSWNVRRAGKVVMR